MKYIILPVVAMASMISLHGQAIKESDLTPEELAIYNPVQSKMKADPGIRQAIEKLRVIKVEKITKDNPSLKPLVEKILPPPALNPKDLPMDESITWKKAESVANKDPDVAKANKDLQQAKVDAMLKLNPAVKPILEKLYPNASFTAGALATPTAQE